MTQDRSVDAERRLDVVRQEVKCRVLGRMYRAVDYLSIFVFVFVVYGSALITDYLLLQLAARLVTEVVQRYRIVELWFDYAQIGLAVLGILSMFSHGVLSAYSQWRLDLRLAQEEGE